MRDYDIDNENGVLLTQGTDYTVKYANNVKVGTNTASVTVTGKGNYVGSSDRIYFSIIDASDASGLAKPADLKGAKLAAIAAQPYTGLPVYPDITLTLKGGNAVEYTYDVKSSVYKSTADNTIIPAAVAVSNNTNKGTATVLLTGTKGSSGKAVTIKKTFKITALDISSATANAAAGTYAVKGAAPSTLTVAYNGKTLIKGRDYTVKYSANRKAADGKAAKAVITGKGNYTGKLTVNYAVEPLDLSKVTVSAVTAYDGLKAGKVKVVVTDKNGDALKASQYTLNIYKDKGSSKPYEADEALRAGSTIYVEAVAKDTVNLKTGTKTAKTAFSVGVSVAKAKITVKGAKTYTGSAVTLTGDDLTVSIKVNGTTETLTMGKDYEIASYANNVNKGTATAVIRGIGSYSGTKNVKFKIAAKQFSLSEWISNLLAF